MFIPNHQITKSPSPLPSSISIWLLLLLGCWIEMFKFPIFKIFSASITRVYLIIVLWIENKPADLLLVSDCQVKVAVSKEQIERQWHCLYQASLKSSFSCSFTFYVNVTLPNCSNHSYVFLWLLMNLIQPPTVLSCPEMLVLRP